MTPRDVIDVHEEVGRAELVEGKFSIVFEQEASALYRLRGPRNLRLELALRPGQELSRLS